MTTNYGKDVLNLVGFLKTLVLDILIYKETVYSEQHNELVDVQQHVHERVKAAVLPARQDRLHPRAGDDLRVMCFNLGR